jgi:hypothetical protein
MKRVIVAAVAACILLPHAGAAQNPALIERPVWGPKIQVTPFVGFAAAASRVEHWRFDGPLGSAREDFEVELASGPAGGVTVEMQAVERLAVIGSVAFLTRGETLERSRTSNLTYRHEGSNFVFAKAALALRLRESISELQMHNLSGTIFVGPAFVREMPRSDPGAPAPLLEASNYFGLNAGLDVVVPLPFEGFTLQAGVEDYYIRWNDAELARRNDAIVPGITSAVETDPTHNIVFRAGLSVRVR